MPDIDKKVLEGLFTGKTENFKAACRKAAAETLDWKDLNSQLERDAHNQKVLKELFNGDIKAFNANIAKTRRTKLHWQDVLAHALTLKEYEAGAISVIETLLGYMPLPSATIKEEVFIRANILLRETGQITPEEFFDQCEESVRHIRNIEVGYHGWAEYDAETMQRYEEYMPQWKQPVKNRLKAFLGYGPTPQHSAGVELILREELATDLVWKDGKPMIYDFFAINVIKYREVLLMQGKDAADSSPLYAQDIRLRQQLPSK